MQSHLFLALAIALSATACQHNEPAPDSGKEVTAGPASQPAAADDEKPVAAPESDASDTDGPTRLDRIGWHWYDGWTSTEEGHPPRIGDQFPIGPHGYWFRLQRKDDNDNWATFADVFSYLAATSYEYDKVPLLKAGPCEQIADEHWFFEEGHHALPQGKIRVIQRGEVDTCRGPDKCRTWIKGWIELQANDKVTIRYRPAKAEIYAFGEDGANQVSPTVVASSAIVPWQRDGKRYARLLQVNPGPAQTSEFFGASTTETVTTGKKREIVIEASKPCGSLCSHKALLEAYKPKNNYYWSETMAPLQTADHVVPPVSPNKCRY